MGSSRRAGGGTRIAVAAAVALGVAVFAGRSCPGRPPRRPQALRAPDGAAPAPAIFDRAGPVGPASPGSPPEPASSPPLAPSPSSGWEEEAETVVADLRLLLEGRPRAGAYAEARAEAARADLALFPPDRERVRRLLLGSARDRTRALAALAARPELDDDLLRLVLRSQRPEDGAVARLLAAEIAAAVPAELAARHEDDLLRAFGREPNPLVLAVALPALERVDEPRLLRLLGAQLADASPEMLPVLLALARDRLSPGALEDLQGALASGLRRE